MYGGQLHYDFCSLGRRIMGLSSNFSDDHQAIHLVYQDLHHLDP